MPPPSVSAAPGPLENPSYGCVAAAAASSDQKKIIPKHLVELNGKVQDRWGPIARSGDFKRIEGKALRLGSDARHVIDDTERTIKFGLFTLTLMFFRSIKLVRREKDSWTETDRAINKRKVMMTSEREKIIEEEKKRQLRLGRIDSYNIKAEVGAYLAEVDPALATMKELEGRLVQTLSSRPPDDNTETKDYNGYVLSASVKRVAKTILDKMIEARIDDELKAGDGLVVQAFDS